LQDQRKYLEEKNNEIEIAKNTINATTKKFDEEKMLISVIKVFLENFNNFFFSKNDMRLKKKLRNIVKISKILCQRTNHLSIVL